MRVVLQRCLVVVGAVGAGVALAWWANQPGSGSVAETAPPPVRAGLTPTDGAALAPPAATESVPALAQPGSVAAATALPISFAAPRSLWVGELQELVVRVGANAVAGEVSFTLHFDPDVLQARSGAPGDAASGTGFVAEIPDAGDRVQVRTALGWRAIGAGGSVASVQFQAVGAGATMVMISDVTVRNSVGKPVPFLLATSSLQLTAEAPPPPAARQPAAVAPEAHEAETLETGD